MVQHRHGNQHGVKGETAQRLNLDLGVGMTTDADKAHQALVASLDSRLQSAAFAGHLVQPVEIPDVVQPPLVDVIGLEPFQALLELAASPSRLVSHVLVAIHISRRRWAATSPTVPQIALE